MIASPALGITFITGEVYHLVWLYRKCWHNCLSVISITLYCTTKISSGSVCRATWVKHITTQYIANWEIIEMYPFHKNTPDLSNNLGPFSLTQINLIPAWISNPISRKSAGWYYQSISNFNSFTAEVCEWISNFTPHLITYVTTYPC